MKARLSPPLRLVSLDLLDSTVYIEIRCYDSARFDTESSRARFAFDSESRLNTMFIPRLWRHHIDSDPHLNDTFDVDAQAVEVLCPIILEKAK